MDHAHAILVNLEIGIQIQITVLDALPWRGILCEECGSNIITLSLFLEMSIPTDVSSNYSMMEHNVCRECDDVPYDIAHTVAILVSEKYGYPQ